MGKNKNKGRRKKHREVVRSAIQEIPVSTVQPDEKKTTPFTTKTNEPKKQLDWNRLGMIILFFVFLAAVLLCYFVPLCVNVFFIVIKNPNAGLSNYLSSIDRPLAWGSLFLAIASLRRNKKSDDLMYDTHRLIQDMQSKVADLKWEIGTANTRLNEMYTAKSETLFMGVAASTGSNWEKDSVRRGEPN